MPIDHLEVSRMELRDHGDLVTVLPTQAKAFTATMIFDDGIEDAQLGGIRGHLGQPAFYCLPEDDSQIGEGVSITLDGVEYKVLKDGDVIRRRNCLTEIRVSEQ